MLLTQIRKTSIFAVITGNILEWYDFTLYIFLAPVIAQNFFPENNSFNAMLATFAVFALGFFVRPLGSMIFGHLGDKIGRAKTLKINILLLSLSTLCIALLPNYQQWGIYATLSLTVFRLLQGLCIGGEFAGSMIYLTETAMPNKRALTSCMANNGSNFGILCATVVIAILSHYMHEANFYLYGWRIAFILGGITGLIGLWLRQGIVETPVFEKLRSQQRIAKLPIMMVLREHKMAIGHIFLLLIMSASGSYILMNFMSNYLNQYLHYTVAESLKIQSLYNILTFGLVTLFGLISDQYGRRKLLILAALGYMIFSVPCFYFLGTTRVYLWLLPLVVFYCMEQATTPVTMVEMFPASLRYTGISFGYNLAMALVGGTAPLINTWLIIKFNNILFPAYYLAIGAAISLWIIATKVPRNYGPQLDLANN